MNLISHQCDPPSKAVLTKLHRSRRAWMMSKPAGVVEGRPSWTAAREKVKTGQTRLTRRSCKADKAYRSFNLASPTSTPSSNTSRGGGEEPVKMKTPSGHYNHLLTPSYSLYAPIPFPALEQRLFPPRHPQSLEYTFSASFISLLRLLYVLFIVLPVHTFAAVVSHAIWSKHTWIAKGWGRGTFPTRLPGWGVGQTIGVPLVGSLFWALVYGSPRGMDWREERTVPAASRWLFGRGHEGWCIEAEGVTLPALPSAHTHHSNGAAQPNGDVELRKRKVNGRGVVSNADFVDKAADATSLHSSSAAPTPAPYNLDEEDIPHNILRGLISGSQFGVHPTDVPAFWQWKSVAAAVSRGKVISVKPGNDLSGIGSGPALSPTERMVLFFVGGGYHSGHAPQGPLSWTVCRQTSLRVLGVNFRKATKDSLAFPAALQDALAAWVYVTKRLGFRPENVVLMGDSAGGGLALTLQMYLSALMWAGEARLGRAKKLVLHSPMVDLTLDTDSFTRNDRVDIISPYMCSLARDNYLRHVIPVAGRKNARVDGKGLGEGMIDEVAGRYDIDPYGLEAGQVEGDAKLQSELKRLAAELPETILELGAFHPLFSLGLDARQHRYLAQSLLLFHPPPSHPDADMELLVTAGTGEIFYDQIKLFVRNLLDLHSPASSDRGDKENKRRSEEKVKVSLVECVDWHHVFAYMNLPGKVKAQVDDVAKVFMLA